jgi:hypothetical protein
MGVSRELYCYPTPLTLPLGAPTVGSRVRCEQHEADTAACAAHVVVASLISAATGWGTPDFGCLAQAASGGGGGGGGVCAATEYCCPDAKHCLAPVPNATCGGTKACASGQTCCPLTKICVTVGAACKSPCTDQGSYCCPDAKQ